MTVSSQIADNYVDAIKELIDDKENFNIIGKPQRFLHIACIFSFLCHICFWDQTKQYLQTKFLFTDWVITKTESLSISIWKEKESVVDKAIQKTLDKS